MYNKNKGYVYEKIAVNYLSHKGYKIIKENYTCRLGEIDIIALKDGRIHFVEVKGRINTKYGYPREAVTRAKQKRIISAAKYYFMLSDKDYMPCQFDVIEIIASSREINYIEDAFQT